MEGPTGGAFDGSGAVELIAELRRGFDSGRTRSYEWRAEQLKGIARMIEEKEAEIMAALHDDLAKPRLESFLHEVPQSLSISYRVILFDSLLDRLF